MNVSKNKRKREPHLKLKGWMVENQISRRELAGLLGINPVTLTRKINGYTHFSFDEVEKICNEYGAPVDIFLSKSVE